MISSEFRCPLCLQFNPRVRLLKEARKLLEKNNPFAPPVSPGTKLARMGATVGVKPPQPPLSLNLRGHSMDEGSLDPSITADRVNMENEVEH